MQIRTTKKRGGHGSPAWLAAGLAVVLAGCGNSGEESLVKGEQLLREGQYPAAIEELTRATGQLPGDWRGYNYLGMAHQRQGDYEKAKEQYQKALGLVDQNPGLVNEVNVVHFNLGRLYLDHGRPVHAASELATYTMQAGGSYDGWFWRGTAEYQAGTSNGQQGMLERAEVSLRRAIELDTGSAAAFNRLGMAQMALEKPVDARASFMRAHELDKNFAPAILNLAVSHEQHPGPDAHQSLNQAFLFYMSYLALAEEGSESWQAAQAAMNRLNFRLNPPTVAQANPNPNPGAREIPVVPTTPVTPTPTPPLPPLTPDSFTVRVPLDGSGRGTIVPTVPTRPTGPLRNTTVEPPPAPVPPEPSKPVVPPVEPAPPPSPIPTLPSEPIKPTPPPTEIAKAPEPSKPVLPEPPEAAKPGLPEVPGMARYPYTQPARPRDGNRGKANEHFKTAQHAHGINRFGEAIAGYQQAIAADPGYQRAHLNLALAAHEKGDIKKALPSYEMALKLNPLSVDARYNFALALQRGGFHLDAARECQRLLTDLPNLLNGHLLLANVYSENLKLPRRAKPHYQKVLEMNPRHAQAPSIRQWLIAHP